MSKVVKYTCRLRRYNYTHNHFNTRHLKKKIRIFLRGGAQNLSLPPGASYPRYATEEDNSTVTDRQMKILSVH